MAEEGEFNQFITDDIDDIGNTGGAGSGQDDIIDQIGVVDNGPTPTPTPTVTVGGCDIIAQNCPTGFVCQIVSSPGGAFGLPTFSSQCVEIILPTPTPTITPTITPTVVTSECDIIAQNCPPGFVCQIVSSPGGPLGLPIFSSRCVEVVPPRCPPQGEFLGCSNIDGLGIYAGGESPPDQPCYTFTAATPSCTGEVTCPPIGTFIRCTELLSTSGRIAEYSNGLQNGQCSSYTAIATQEQCPTAPVYCNMRDESALCSTILGPAWSGDATRTVNVLVNGQPTPSGCTTFPGIGDWNTSECTRIQCPPKDTFKECSKEFAVYYSGEINPTTNTCGTFEVYEPSRCLPPDPCKPANTFLYCELKEVDIEGQRVITNAVFARGYVGADEEQTSEGCPIYRANSPECTTPPRWRRCIQQSISRAAFPQFIDGTPPSDYTESTDIFGVCYNAPPLPSPSPTPSISATPLPSPSPTPSISATPVASPSPTPSISATPAASSIPGVTPSPTPSVSATPRPSPPLRWRQCGLSAFIGGTPPVNYTQSTDGTGVCYNPPLQWRDCISGQLNEGAIPVEYRKSIFTVGGECWEPRTVIGFQPSLSTALTFTYQRGSNEIPQPTSVIATNPSYGVSYRVSIQTNPDIIVQPSSFIMTPRSREQFFINVTPILLDKLGDGTSTIEMSIDIVEI
jgi:hypothetical protein